MVAIRIRFDLQEPGHLYSQFAGKTFKRHHRFASALHPIISVFRFTGNMRRVVFALIHVLPFFFEHGLIGIEKRNG